MIPSCHLMVTFFSPNGREKGSLLLFRKVAGPGTHSTALPKEATADDLTVHLWLICAGVSGMDVADVRYVEQ